MIVEVLESWPEPAGIKLSAESDMERSVLERLLRVGSNPALVCVLERDTTARGRPRDLYMWLSGRRAGEVVGQ